MINNKKNIFNTITNRSIIIYKNYYEYIITISLSLLLLILSMIIASCSPFGINSIINEDGLMQIFPEFVSQINEIKAGHIFPFYTLSIGGFKDTFNMTGMNYIISPWLILVYKIVPERYYYLFYSINFFLYFFLSGFSIIYYMKHKHNYAINNKKQLIIIGVSYTLCSYSVLYFKYMAGFKYMPFIPLIVLGLEHIVYKNKYSLYIITLFLLMVYNPYQAFLACEFIVLFFFTLNFKNFKHFILSGVRFAIASLSTAGLSSLWLIPYFFMITSSVYSTRDSSKPSILCWFSNIFDVLNEYRISNFQFTVSSNNSQVSIYCGMIMLLAIPIFIMNKKLTFKYKFKKLTLLLLLFISFDNELLNYIMHGFHYQTYVPNRFAIFFVFVLVNIFSEAINSDLPKVNKLIPGFLVVILLYIYVYFIYNKNILSGIISISILILYTIIIIYFSIRKKKVNNILFYLIIAEISLNFLVLFSYTIGKTGDDYNKTIKIINNISNETTDMKNPFNKTEYLSTDGSYLDISNATNINSISYFASDYSEDTSQRTIYYNILCSANALFYMNGNPFADMMLGIKYHIENYYDDESISLYDKLYTYNNYNVYQNPYYVSPMFVVKNKATINDIDRKNYNNALEYQNALSNAICGDNLFDIIPIEEYYEGIPKEKIYYKYGEIYESKFHNDPVNMQEISINIKSSGVYIACDYMILYLGDSSENDDELSISIPIEENAEKSSYKPSIGIINWNTMKKMHDVLSQSKAEECISNGHSIMTSINVKENGTLYISLPYYEGWKAYVDGKQVETYRFMGSMGIDIDSGQHDIKLVYLPKGVIPALIITITTIVLIILYNIIIYYRRKVKKSIDERKIIEE